MREVEVIQEHCSRCDRGHRFYHVGDTSIFPSVTTIIGWAFREYDNPSNPAALQFAADRSVQVHKACMLVSGVDNRKKLDLSSLDDETGPRVEAFTRWKRDGNWSFKFAEETVISRRRGYAGRLDLIGCNGSGRAIIDIKCMAGSSRTVGLQLAAYSAAFLEDMHGTAELNLKHEFIVRRIVLYLNPDLPSGYKAATCTDFNDYNIFLSALTCFNWWHRS